MTGDGYLTHFSKGQNTTCLRAPVCVQTQAEAPVCRARHRQAHRQTGLLVDKCKRYNP